MNFASIKYKNKYIAIFNIKLWYNYYKLKIYMDLKESTLSCFMENIKECHDILSIIKLDDFLKPSNPDASSVCPICLNICILPAKPNKCMHIFCFNCINAWFSIKKRCPLCRKYFNKILFYK